MGLYKKGDSIIIVKDAAASDKKSEKARTFIIHSVDSSFNEDSPSGIFYTATGEGFYYRDIEGFSDKKALLKRLEEVEKEKTKREEAAQQHKQTMKEVLEIANGIFTPERVEMTEEDGYHYLVIHFPEVLMTNSHRKKHTIKDLFVQFVINKRPYGEVNIINIGFNGTRTTLTIEEINSNYLHSHLPKRRGTEWHNFCLGSSSFGLQIGQTRQSNSIDDWALLLYSLENYVKWESLEGGPHIRIESIAEVRPDNTTAVLDAVIRNASKFPADCFAITSNSLHVVDFEGLTETMDEFFPIKSFNTSSSEFLEQQKKQLLRGVSTHYRKIVFKGKNFPLTISVPKVEEAVKVIDPEIVKLAVERLKANFSPFLKKHKHEQIRQKYSNRIFPDPSVTSIGA